MTALAILAAPERVILVTDTQSVGGPQYEPVAFTSKVLILPHLHMVIAAKGVFGIAESFFDQIRSSPHKDFAAVHQIAPEYLRYFWADCVKVHSLTRRDIVEVHLIGVDAASGACTSFGYRSQNGFKVERLPERSVYPDSVDSTLRRLADEAKLTPVSRGQAATAHAPVIAIAEDQRRAYIAAGQPHAVGGRLNVTELTPQAITTRTVHTFDGFDEAAAQMANRVAQPAVPQSSGGWLRKLLGGSR